MDRENEQLGVTCRDLENTWVDGSWKQQAEALEKENKLLKARIAQLERNGRRDF